MNILEFTSKQDADQMNTLLTVELNLIEEELDVELSHLFASVFQASDPQVNFWLLADPRETMPLHAQRLQAVMDDSGITFATKPLPYENDYPEELVQFFTTFSKEPDLSVEFQSPQPPRPELDDGKTELRVNLTLAMQSLPACDAFKVFVKDFPENYMIGIGDFLDSFPVQDVCYAMACWAVHPEFYDGLKEKCRVIAGDFTFEATDSSLMFVRSFLNQEGSVTTNEEKSLIIKYWRDQIQLAFRV
jgi:hypothetical protein